MTTNQYKDLEGYIKGVFDEAGINHKYYVLLEKIIAEACTFNIINNTFDVSLDSKIRINDMLDGINAVPMIEGNVQMGFNYMEHALKFGKR